MRKSEKSAGSEEKCPICLSASFLVHEKNCTYQLPRDVVFAPFLQWPKPTEYNQRYIVELTYHGKFHRFYYWAKDENDSLARARALPVPFTSLLRVLD